MPSSRCLFRLVPSEPPTDETGCSSSQGEKRIPTDNGLYGTPRADIAKVTSLESKALAARVHKYGNLEEQIAFQLQNELLPTPRANVVNGCDLDNPKLAERNKSNLEEEVAKAVVNGLLPTPTAIEGVKWTNTWNPNSQMGQSLSAMAGSGMLPTPFDWKLNGGMLPTPRTMEVVEKPEAQANRLKDRTGNQMNNIQSAAAFGMLDPMTPDSLKTESQGKNAGQTSRLSPLFTEEMMGFPLMWTALPFLSESGAPKPSKPTATPSSPK